MAYLFMTIFEGGRAGGGKGDRLALLDSGAGAYVSNSRCGNWSRRMCIVQTVSGDASIAAHCDLSLRYLTKGAKPCKCGVMPEGLMSRQKNAH